MDVDDVKASLCVDAAELRAEQRSEGQYRFGGVHVDGIGPPDPNDLEELISGRNVVDGSSWNEQPRRDQRYLVAATRELRCLTVSMLSDPTELRVVVLGDDCDAHTENR